MSYGDPTTEGAHRWALADDEAQPFFRQAIELGITFWDAANVYQAGTSEEVTGRAIRRYSAARTSCWPPRCSARCTTAPAVRPVPQGHHGADRRLPDPARHRLHRPVPDPPLRPRHPGRRDDGGPARHRQGRARSATSARRRCTRGSSPSCSTPPARAAGPGRVHAEPVQPAAPPGRARADGHVRRRRRRPGALLPPGQGPPGPPLGRSPPGPASTTSCRPSTPPDQPVVNAVQALASARGVTMAQVALAGCCVTRPSPPRSSARPDRITWRKPSPRSS